MGKYRVIYMLLLLSVFIVITIPMPGVKAQETLIFNQDVPSDGTTVTGPVLKAGYEYRIVAYGVFWDVPAGTYQADAQYYTTNQWATYTQPDSHSFLQIDETDVNWGMWSNTPYWHTYTIYRIGTGMGNIRFRIVDWVDLNYDNNYCRLHVYIYEGPMVPPIGETAWADGDEEYAHCFKEYGINNWGWTKGPLPPSELAYEFDIYAGAGKCDITKGTIVGTLTVDYDGMTATVRYDLDEPWMMDYAQLYVGSEPLPMTKQGKYTASPGAFPYQQYFPEWSTTATFEVPDLSGDIYVAAHCDVFEA